ncbi:MAG TPA: cytidine deaminase [Terriglobia bacterium]|nr:cytidine deaminase [Terriglobia bacterium]
MTSEQLVQAALDARLNAVAPYSNFKVGAALLTPEGKIYTGCNVENATYGLSMCAERVALFKALSEGERGFRRIVVASDSARPATPCGACRQLLWEFAGEIEVILVNPQGQRETFQLAALLPQAFDGRFFAKK